MIYLLAGHHFNPNGADPGAVTKDYKEAELTRELRDLTAGYLADYGAPFITDKDHETLPQLLQRIKPGSGSVLCDLHFNASANLATGVEAFVNADVRPDDRAIAGDLCNAGVRACGFYNRGIKTEKQSQHKRLAILHTQAGIQVLLEVCFLTNRDDMIRYQRYKHTLAMMIATVLLKWEKKYN